MPLPENSMNLSDFIVTGERPNYYGVLKESAILMELELTN